MQSLPDWKELERAELCRDGLNACEQGILLVMDSLFKFWYRREKRAKMSSTLVTVDVSRTFVRVFLLDSFARCGLGRETNRCIEIIRCYLTCSFYLLLFLSSFKKRCLLSHPLCNTDSKTPEEMFCWFSLWYSVGDFTEELTTVN